jgi:hypothetical protein
VDRRRDPGRSPPRLPQDETAAFPAEGTKVTVRPVNGASNSPTTHCDVYYGGKPPVQLTRQEKWQLPVTDITRDTHFRVQVTLKRSGETITHHLSTAVAVEEPTIDLLTVKSIRPNGPDNIEKTPYLRIEGAVVVDKACHVSGTLYGAGGSLTVGDSVVAKKNLTVGTGMNVTGAVASTGDITTDAQLRDAKGTPLRGQLS